MKLYFHPISTTSRPITLFAADHGLQLDYEVVDLFAGEQVQPAYRAINPNQAVPVLEDGDFRLTESSAILKYLADKVGTTAYPQDLRLRARINERMDWFNTTLSRDFGHGFVYPQVLPTHNAPTRARSAPCSPGAVRRPTTGSRCWTRAGSVRTASSAATTSHSRTTWASPTSRSARLRTSTSRAGRTCRGGSPA